MDARSAEEPLRRCVTWHCTLYYFTYSHTSDLVQLQMLCHLPNTFEQLTTCAYRPRLFMLTCARHTLCICIPIVISLETACNITTNGRRGTIPEQLELCKCTTNHNHWPWHGVAEQLTWGNLGDIFGFRKPSHGYEATPPDNIQVCHCMWQVLPFSFKQQN